MEHDSASRIANDIKRWLGISENGLLLYSREGILRPGEQGAHALDLIDVNKLFQSRILTGFGFTVQQAADMMRDCGVAEQHHMLDNMECAMQDELVSLAERLRCIHQRQSLLRELENDPGACSLVPAPELWFLPVHDMGEGRATGESDCAQWLSHVPYVIPAVMGRVGEWEGQIWMGPSATGRDLRRLALPTEYAVPFQAESSLHLRGFLHYPIGSHVTAAVCAHLLEYAQSQGVQIFGSYLSRHLVYEREGEDWWYWDEIFLPVRQEN